MLRPFGRRFTNTSGARVALAALLLSGAAFAHAARQRGAPTWDTIWAEDGSVFLTDALRDFRGSILEVSGGYVHLVPRMLGGIASVLPLDAAAAVFAAGGAIVLTLIAAFVYFASGEVLPSRVARLVLAGAVVFLPIPGSELLANGLNLHFYLLFACFWAMVTRSETTAALVGRSVIVAAATLSDPLATLFVPLAVVAPVLRRTRRAMIIPAVFAAGVVIQLLLIGGATSPERNWGFALGDFPDIIGLRVAGGMLVGDRFLGDLWLEFGRAFAFGALLLIAALLTVLLLRSTRETAAFALLCLAYGGLFIFVQLVGRGTAAVAPDVGSFHVHHARYVLLPYLFATTALLVLIDRGKRRHGSAGWVWTRRVVLCWLVLVLAVNYSLFTDRSEGPTWHDQLAAARESCRASAMADEVRVLVAPAPPEVWFVRARCDRL